MTRIFHSQTWGVSFVWGWFTWSMWKRTIIGLWHGWARLMHKLTDLDYSWCRGKVSTVFTSTHSNNWYTVIQKYTIVIQHERKLTRAVSAYKNLALTFSYTKHISHDLIIHNPCFLRLKNSVLVERSLIFCLPSWLDSPS